MLTGDETIEELEGIVHRLLDVHDRIGALDEEEQLDIGEAATVIVAVSLIQRGIHVDDVERMLTWDDDAEWSFRFHRTPLQLRITISFDNGTKLCNV